MALPLVSPAQVPGRVLPTQPAQFYTPDFLPATQFDTTAYCAETMFRDSLGNGVTRVYYPTGQLRQYVPYANVYRGVRHGTVTTWYKDGQMCTKEDYLRGVRQGELLTYYPDGTLKRRETYENGHCGIGSCYGPDGQPVPYFVYEQLPLYPGGGLVLIKELSKAVRLNPQEVQAMRRESYRQSLYFSGTQREVDVQLAVAPDGHIADARVVHSTARFLNEAVLRAVAKLKRPFVPGSRDGQVMVSYLTVPVYYTVEAPNQGAYRTYQSPRRW